VGDAAAWTEHASNIDALVAVILGIVVMELHTNPPAGRAHNVVGEFGSMEKGLVPGRSGSDNDDRFRTGEREVAKPLFPLSLSFSPYFLLLKKSGEKPQP
jgi:hypothetical protein